MSVASSRGAPGQRQPKQKAPFGTVRKPLAQKKREQTRMSADASVQSELTGSARCLLLGFMEGDCGDKPQRCHIISQELIRDTYPHGACREHGSEFWVPTTRNGAAATLAQLFRRDDIVAHETITLQQILDMSANLVPGCDVHNKDGIELVEALDARKVAGLPSYPAGFGEFTHEFRFSIEGSTFWYYVPIEGAGA
ncbi:MAG: hypothetical protein KGZ65_06090 [Sphingomonadales bacterium]|nr:hypothetical protein [Sphingomonadaceae bacterium]MBS3930789.1 hypothetical protein [Sphingomonadales bacterium]